MNRVEDLFEQIGHGPIDSNLRLAILDEIGRCLELKKDELGTWEKSLLAQSLAYLSINTASPNQPTSLWLRICLASLEKVMVPRNERNDNYTVDSETTNSITYKFLKGEVANVRRQIT